MHGPTLPFAEELHAEKYRGASETFREAMNRVASVLSDDPGHFHQLRDILLDMRFLPAGRVQAAMGSTKAVTPYNCFVSGTIEDSFVEGHGSIMDRAAELVRMCDKAQPVLRIGGVDHALRIFGVGGDLFCYVVREVMVVSLVQLASDKHRDPVMITLFALAEAFQVVMVVDADEVKPGVFCGGGDFLDSRRAVGVLRVYVKVTYIFLVHLTSAG